MEVLRLRQAYHQEGRLRGLRKGEEPQAMRRLGIEVDDLSLPFLIGWHGGIG
jgi:hypothetical protein